MTKYNVLTVGSCPLHTEKPEWAAHAPAQVLAACKRRSHVIGLTETRGPIVAEVKKIAQAQGYDWYGSPLDSHRNVTLLVKRSLRVVSHEAKVVNNNYRVGVTFEFFGSEVTAFVHHWETTDNAGQRVQTHSLIEAMTEASKGSGLGVYMGDTNPTKPQHMKGSEPSATLKQAGMPSVWQELNEFPPNLGVNIIGHNLADTRIKTLSARLYPALGSDHYPAVARLRVRRLR